MKHQKPEMKDIKNLHGEEIAQLKIENLKTEMNNIKTSNVELLKKIQKLKIKKDSLIKHLKIEMNNVKILHVEDMAQLKIEKQEEITYLKTMHNEKISDVHYKYIFGIIIGSSKLFFLIIVVIFFFGFDLNSILVFFSY